MPRLLRRSSSQIEDSTESMTQSDNKKKGGTQKDAAQFFAEINSAVSFI
jgi:hypothetical protein